MRSAPCLPESLPVPPDRAAAQKVGQSQREAHGRDLATFASPPGSPSLGSAARATRHGAPGGPPGKFSSRSGRLAIAVGVSGAHAGTSMADPDRPLRLLIVDDHEVVRRGLIDFLDRHGQFEVVAEAGTCAEAISQARRLN